MHLEWKRDSWLPARGIVKNSGLSKNKQTIKKWASFIEPFMFIRTSFTMAFAWRPTKSNKGGITKKHNRQRFCTISILHRCNECIVNPERVPPDCNPVIHNKCEVKIAICHLARAQQRMSHSIFVIHFPAILQPQGFTFPTCLHRASYGEDVVMTTTHDNKEEKPLGTSFACLSNIKLQFSCNKGWLEIFCDPKCLGGLEVGGWYRKAVPPAKKKKRPGLDRNELSRYAYQGSGCLFFRLCFLAEQEPVSRAYCDYIQTTIHRKREH